jgi:hypothetical protein
LPTTADTAVLNVNSISIPNTTTGQIINVNKILGLFTLNGTMTTTATTLTGFGTAFLTELAINAVVRKSDGTSLGTVTAITSNTSATVTGGATNATAISAYAGGGASATVTLNVTTSATYTIDSPGGIEAGQIPVVSPSTFVVTGTGGASTIVNFNCGSGNLRGSAISSGIHNCIKLSLTGSTININCINIYGGLTASDNYCIQNAGASNTINITATGEVLPGAAAALNIAIGSGFYNVSADSIKGGSSQPAILSAINSTGVQIFSAANITPSITCPAIVFGNTTSPFINTTVANITATTSVNTSGNGSNPTSAISVTRYYLTTPTIKVYQNSTTENIYSTTAGTMPAAKHVLAGVSVGTTVGTLTQADPATVLDGATYGVISSTNDSPRTGTLNIKNEVWGSLTNRELTSAKNITTDDTKINSTAIKASTDRIPTNPSSIESVGAQLATIFP